MTLFAVMIESEVDGAKRQGLLDLRTQEIDATRLCFDIVNQFKARGETARAWYEPRNTDDLPIKR